MRDRRREGSGAPADADRHLRRRTIWKLVGAPWWENGWPVLFIAAFAFFAAVALPALAFAAGPDWWAFVATGLVCLAIGVAVTRLWWLSIIRRHERHDRHHINVDQHRLNMQTRDWSRSRRPRR
jgi:hypothetical protein